jgi:hypothetical protein
MPVAQGLLQAGRPELFNAMLEDWGSTMNFDISRYMVPPPPPPPQEAPPQEQPPE